LAGGFQGTVNKRFDLRIDFANLVGKRFALFNETLAMLVLTQPPDPGRLFGESVRLSFWVDVGGQGPVSGAPA